MNRKSFVISLIATMLVVVLLLPSYAQASSGLAYSGNSSDRLRIEASAVRGQSSEVEFTAFNDGSSDLSCTVWVGSQYSWWITFDDPSFTLGPGEKKKVKMIVEAPYNGSNRNEFTVFLKGTPVGGSGTIISQGYEISTVVTLSGPTEAPSGPDDQDPSDGQPTDPKDKGDDFPWIWVGLVAAIIAGIAGFFVYRMKFRGGAQK